MKRKSLSSPVKKRVVGQKKRTDLASIAFRKGLAARGEAQDCEAEEPLPEGATHRIIAYDNDGIPIVKRIRFSSH